jgi:hypothetical protein
VRESEREKERERERERERKIERMVLYPQFCIKDMFLFQYWHSLQHQQFYSLEIEKAYFKTIF